MPQAGANQCCRARSMWRRSDDRRSCPFRSSRIPVLLVNSARSRSWAARAAATESGVGAYGIWSSERDALLAWSLSMLGVPPLFDQLRPPAEPRPTLTIEKWPLFDLSIINTRQPFDIWLTSAVSQMADLRGMPAFFAGTSVRPMRLSERPSRSCSRYIPLRFFQRRSRRRHCRLPWRRTVNFAQGPLGCSIHKQYVVVPPTTSMIGVTPGRSGPSNCIRCGGPLSKA